MSPDLRSFTIVRIPPASASDSSIATLHARLVTREGLILERSFETFAELVEFAWYANRPMPRSVQ